MLYNASVAWLMFSWLAYNRTCEDLEFIDKYFGGNMIFFLLVREQAFMDHLLRLL